MVTILENDAATLLKHCAERMARQSLEDDDLEMLKSWNSQTCESSALAEQFLSASPTQWEDLILAHPAHQHGWYDFVEKEITIDQIAAFLLENNRYPVFLRLLEAISAVQICDDGRRAVEENIADEQHPVPHAELMRTMMEAVRSRARADLELSVYPALVNRTLVFYYGFYCDPWHLVGSVFATERMGTRRVQCMDKGLRRLGLDDDELAFTVTHAECDDHHASDWLERVIVPSIELDARLGEPIAKGLATCLETSQVYLDFLLQRVARNA